MFKSIIRKAILVATLSLISSNVFAQDAAYKKEFNRAMELTHPEETMKQMIAPQYQKFGEMGLLKLDDVDAVVEECIKVIMPKYKEVMLKLYAENYTLNEVKEMNAYLATPVGQKGIKLAPKFGFAGMQAVQEPEIAKKIEDILKKHIQIKE
jgi:hypothetical protein